MLTADAVKFYGSKIAVARALGVCKTAISKWGKYVPPLSAARLHEKTGGKLKFSPDSRRYKHWYSPRSSAKQKRRVPAKATQVP